MFDLLTLGFVTVFLLIGYLYYSINRRITGDKGKQRSRHFRATPIDVTTLNPAIQRARGNPASELHRPPHQNKQRSRLVANARALVENLAFFRHRGEEHGQQND